MEHHDHLTPEMLHQFLNQDRGPEVSQAFLHLLAVCSECYAVGGSILDFYRAGAIRLDFCSIDVQLAESRRDAPALFEKLRRFSFEQQSGLIRDAAQFRSWGLAELLCRESEHAATTAAGRAVELAELAVAVASHLGEWQPAEHTWLCQLRGLAFATLANARRVLGELRSAAQAFREADRHWNEGTGNAGDSLGYQARFLALKASLRREERHLREALALLDQALEAESGPALRGAILVNKASVLEELGEVDLAIATLREAETAVSPAEEPRLYFGIRHNLLLFLTASGRLEEAGAMVKQVTLLCRDLGNELDLVRLRWVEARIAGAAGERETAAELLAEVRSEFLARGMAYDAALASLEVAVLHTEAGRTAEARATAQAILPIFEAQQVPREALAAISVFAGAIDGSAAADAALLRQLAKYLEKARYNPDLLFES